MEGIFRNLVSTFSYREHSPLTWVTAITTMTLGVLSIEQIEWMIDVTLSLIWSKGVLVSVSRWLSSQFERRRSRMSKTWFTSAERSRSCHPSATHTSFLYMKVKVCCVPADAHTHKHACAANHTLLFHLNLHQQKTQMSKISPSFCSFSTCGQAPGVSCYDMQMS